nr:hypothetical protein [Tanacetum cinerariifolium]
MTSLKDINDPTEVINSARILFAKAFQLTTPTNNNQRTSCNLRNHQIAQPGMNISQDRQSQNIGGNDGNQFRQGLGHIVRNCTTRPRRKDAAYLQTQLLIAQKEEVQLQAEEFYFMDAAGDLDEIKEVNANCILMANLQHASTSGTQLDKAPVYDTDGSAEFGQYVGQVAQNQQGHNAWQNGGIQVAQNTVQNAGVQSGGNQNRLVVVQGITNQNGTGNVVAARAEGTRHGNQAKCYNCRGLGHIARNCTARPRGRDVAYLQTQLLIAQKEEAGIQLQAEEFDFMTVAGDLDEIEEVNANCILMANLQHASSSEQYTDLLEPIPEPQLVPQNDNHITSVSPSMVQSGGTVETNSAPNEETCAHQETVYRNLVDQVAQEADESLDKQKSLELKIERLLKASVSHDIMSIVQNGFVDVASDLQTELDRTKEKLKICIIKEEKECVVLWNNWYTKCEECKYDKISYDKAYNDMQQKVERLQAQLRGLKGISVTPHVDKPKLIAVTPHSKKLHASIPSHSVPQPREFNVVKHSNVITLGMFKIDPPQTSRVDMVPNKQSSASIRTNLITNFQRHVNFKENVSSDTVNASSTGNIKLLINFVWKCLGTVRFGNDHIAAILGYGDLKWGNITITRVASINGKRYVLVIVDDYSRYTWVHFLRTKDETPEQNGVVERRNHTLVEAARTMLIFSHASLFLWAEAIATACYTQNSSIIHRSFNKIPYELIQGRNPDISYLHVFLALCYPKNDREDISKLGAKGDIGFFIGYSANSVAYRVYNQRTKKIIETMNVTFDELSAMDFEQNSSRPGLQSLTSGQISSELELTYAPLIISPQRPSERDLNILFEPLHNEYPSGLPSETLRIIHVALVLQNLQAPTASMSIQDSAPAPTNSSNTPVSSHNVDAPSQQHV